MCPSPNFFLAFYNPIHCSHDTGKKRSHKLRSISFVFMETWTFCHDGSNRGVGCGLFVTHETLSQHRGLFRNETFLVYQGMIRSRSLFRFHISWKIFSIFECNHGHKIGVESSCEWKPIAAHSGNQQEIHETNYPTDWNVSDREWGLSLLNSSIYLRGRMVKCRCQTWQLLCGCILDVSALFCNWMEEESEIWLYDICTLCLIGRIIKLHSNREAEKTVFMLSLFCSVSCVNIACILKFPISSVEGPWEAI